MWNIIKAQNYQMKKDIMVVLLAICGLVLLIVPNVLDSSGDMDGLTGSVYLLQTSELLLLIFSIICLLLTCRICGWDYMDKTINYEILSGHSRKEVYWGRIVTSGIWSVVFCYVLGLLPLFIFTIVNGWGVNMNMGNVMFRYALMIFPILRMVCEFALLTFLLRNCYGAMVIGWTLFALSMIGVMFVEELTDTEWKLQLAYTNMSMLFDFSHGRLGYVGGEDVMIYETAVDLQTVLGTIGVSLLVSAVCLALGYLYYKKSDQR
ncbi:MAG: ABC transporter permease [Lachnospiraceae bacterium]|nr:ABC transporter permease [Lachnospiraceae bacterium]